MKESNLKSRMYHLFEGIIILKNCLMQMIDKNYSLHKVSYCRIKENSICDSIGD